jgi:Mitochondrial ribosomal protein (VAR1)
MIKTLKKVCTIQQPGSLTKTYFYNFNNAKRYKIYKLLSIIFQILNYFFSTFYCIISKPVFLFTQKTLTIYINYYIPRASYKLSRRHLWKYQKLPVRSATKLTLELKKLIKLLSKLLNLKVELQLNKLNYPYHDSTILSKLIAFNTNKRRFTSIMKLIIKKSSIITNTLKTYKDNEDFLSVVSGPKTLKIHKSIPTILTGLKVKISGRLITQRVIPKRTISKTEIGGFKKTKKSIVDYAIYTNKNKRGSYSVKVWSTSRICI